MTGIKEDFRKKIYEKGAEGWRCEICEKEFFEVEELISLNKPFVYLSPDADEELEDVSDNYIYVIGGFVDRQVKKKKSLQKFEKVKKIFDEKNKQNFGEEKIEENIEKDEKDVKIECDSENKEKDSNSNIKEDNTNNINNNIITNNKDNTINNITTTTNPTNTTEITSPNKVQNSPKKLEIKTYRFPLKKNLKGLQNPNLNVSTVVEILSFYMDMPNKNWAECLSTVVPKRNVGK